MEMGGTDFGGSLAVANVQQLASSSKDVPSRYIRPELELDLVSSDEFVQVPVIDVSRLVDGGGDQDREEELDRLHSACKDWGFFQVINHGIANDLILKMKVDVQEFFNLPLQEKMEYAQLPNSVEGYGQAFVVSEEQKLDWGDMLFISPNPTRNMRFWPRVPSSFRATLDQYSWEMKKLAATLLAAMARNLGLQQPEKLPALFEQGQQGVRMNYYPPCKRASKVVGLNSHSDATGLTLLTQVNEVQGLQIKKDGKWVPIVPIEGAFVVNVGDVIEIMSNGEYKSIEHRAVVNSKKERLSIATFHSPNIDAMIGPLPDLLVGEKKQAPNYISFPHEDYIRLCVSTKLDGKCPIHQFKIQTQAE